MDLMFPKKTAKKKRRKMHRESILHRKDGTCYLCIALHGDYRLHKDLHRHHIFGGSNRSLSEAYGLAVYLCLEHHEFGPEAVHNNAEVAEILHRIGQEAFEKTYPDTEFLSLFGKNYL